MQIFNKIQSLSEIIISHLSMLSIRSKKIYVFGSWKGDKFSDNPKYLYLEAMKDKSLIPVWITRNKDIYTALKAKGYKVYYYKSFYGIYYQLRASVYFTCMSKLDVLSVIMGNATRVNLWHGVGFKKILNDDKITNKRKSKNLKSIKSKIWDALHYLPRRKEFIVSTSDQITEIYKSAFGKKRDKIIQLGQPRNDVFFNNGFELEPFKYKSSNKKIILYMPTHRNEGRKQMRMATILDLNELDKFCAENNFLFLVKKHYYHNQEIENFNQFKYVKDITHDDIDAQQMLKYADVLITDYSSCFIDFLLLNRPIIFYNYDLIEYVLNDRDLYFDYEATTPGIKAKNFEELLSALNNALVLNKDAFENQREQIKNIFYSKNNQKEVGRNILDFIQEKIR